MKIMWTLVVIPLVGCNPPMPVTEDTMKLSVSLCEPNDGLKSLRPETIFEMGIVTCNNGASFYLDDTTKAQLRGGW